MSRALRGTPYTVAAAQRDGGAKALTRREFVVGAGVGIATLGFADAAAADGAKTRMVDTAKGRVEVPARPARIVSIQPAPLSTLYDLHVPVLGVYDLGAQYVPPRYRERWTAAPKIGTAGQISIEKVAALRPDVIIGANYSWNSGIYDKLTAIAPTVLTSTDSWVETARMTANAVNRASGISVLKQRVAARSAELSKTYADVLGRYHWDLLQGGFTSGEYWIYGPDSDIGRVYAGAGVRFASATRSTHGGYRTVSYEQIDLLSDAGVLGYYANYDGTPTNEAPKLFAQRGFTRLAAVESRRLVPVPDFLLSGYGDALAALNELEAGLKKLRRAA